MEGYSRQSDSNQNYSGKKDLEKNEFSLRKYNRYIANRFYKVSKTLDSPDCKVLDFGAGTGTLARLWKELTSNYPDCLEIDPEFFEYLRKDSISTFTRISDIKEAYSFIYTSNVLEHIENDFETVNNLKAILSPGGIIAVYVPAFNTLYSNLDRRVGHYRRYEKKELTKLFTSNGFKIIKCEYVDSIGFIATLVSKVLEKIGAEITENSKSLIIYDRIVFPISLVLDKIIFRFICGKNLFLVAQNPK